MQTHRDAGQKRGWRQEAGGRDRFSPVHSPQPLEFSLPLVGAG